MRIKLIAGASVLILTVFGLSAAFYGSRNNNAGTNGADIRVSDKNVGRAADSVDPKDSSTDSFGKVPVNIPAVTLHSNVADPEPYVAEEIPGTDVEDEEQSLLSSDTPDAIKEKIYDIDVEYIEDVALLDDIVHESADDPEGLWEGDWVSVDDWKRYDDIVKIEKTEDGSFRLLPEKESARSYHFDETAGEFIWEMDYYGKTITHKAKFISSDVMVLMKISGIKVALDIYKRDAG